MKYLKTITMLVFCIIIFSLAASTYGIFSTQGSGQSEFQSIHGQLVSIYGKGLYKNNSVAIVAQGKVQE